MEEVKLAVKLRKTKAREPVVLTKEELLGLLDRLEGQHRLAAGLQDGGGLRLSEVVRLRVKDVDSAREQITVRCGKNDRDRTTVLPKRVKPVLQAATANATKISEIKPLLLRSAGISNQEILTADGR
jgi:integrase